MNTFGDIFHAFDVVPSDRLLDQFKLEPEDRGFLFPIMDGGEAGELLSDLDEIVQREAFDLLLEAAAIDGAGNWQQFRKIIVPLLRPATVVVIALAVINTLKGFDIVFVLTQGGPFYTSSNLAMFMYSETFFKLQVGYGAAIAVALFLLAAIVIVVYFRQTRAAERIYG